jgi:hypothetical protein
VRKTQKWLPRIKNRPRAPKNRPDNAKRRLADFLALLSNADASQTLQTQSLRTYRSPKLYKQTSNALIAVQRDANGLQTH